ncbi:MAG: hypothetical protein K2K85_05095 [Clostridia bacterium]|nr:hypothetical protein [Clostridia bacterium]
MQESFEELLQRAKNGDAEAQKEIGMRYYYGIGVEQNREAAAEWYMKAEMQTQMNSAQHSKSNSDDELDDNFEELSDEELAALENDEDFARYMEEELKKLKSTPTQSSGLNNGKKGDETDKPAPAKKRKLYAGLLLLLMTSFAGIILAISLIIQISGVAKFFGIAILLFSIWASGFYIYSYIKDKHQLICPKCKEQYDYEDDVAYDLTDTVTKTYPYRGKGENMHVVSAKLKYKFRVQCHCHNCNHTREYTKTVLAGKEYWDGAVETVDTEQALEKWYTQKSLTKSPTKKSKIIIGVITAILLLASLISFGNFAIDSQVGVGKDPKDYYGTYYGSIGGEYCYLTIDKDKNAVITTKDGNDTKSYIYIYTTSKKLKGTYEFDEMFDGKGALQIDVGKNQAIILWLNKDDTNEYYLIVNATYDIFYKTNAPNNLGSSGNVNSGNTGNTGSNGNTVNSGNTDSTGSSNYDAGVIGYYTLYYTTDSGYVSASKRNDVTLRLNSNYTYSLTIYGETTSGKWKYSNGKYYLDDVITCTYKNNEITIQLSSGVIIVKK